MIPVDARYRRHRLSRPSSRSRRRKDTNLSIVAFEVPDPERMLFSGQNGSATQWTDPSVPVRPMTTPGGATLNSLVKPGHSG